MKQKQKQVYFGTVSFGKASRFLGKRLLITRGIYSDLNQNNWLQESPRPCPLSLFGVLEPG